MNADEQSLIDGLFSRLQDAERQSAPRDTDAQAQISQHLAQQPAAPYYMAQTILIQEAALKALDQRVRELETQLAEQQRQRPSSGGFLAGLFGSAPANTPAQTAQRPAGWGETRFSQPPAAQQAVPGNIPGAAAPSGGFMRGALQTAAGVAGGMVAAEMLTSLFHHPQPQEVVEVIEERAPSYDDSGYADSDGFAGDDSGGSDFFDDDSMFS